MWQRQKSINNSKYDLRWVAVVKNQKYDTWLSYLAFFVYYTIPSLFTSFEAFSENLQIVIEMNH